MTLSKIVNEAREECRGYIEELPRHEARAALRDYQDSLEQQRNAAKAVVDDPEASQHNDEAAYVALARARLQLPIIRKTIRRLEADTVENKLPDIFEGRPTLRDHAEEIVGKYRSNPGSLPEDMEPFKQNWVPDDSGENGTKGISKVNMIQRGIRKADLSDEYSDPESFCDLVERLVERHDTARS